MFKNYVIVALRNLKRHKFFSFINIFGLAISMSVCLGIIMLVADQLMYDRYNTNGHRIYRVNTEYLDANGNSRGIPYATTPLPMAVAFREDYTGVEKSVRIRRGFGNPWIEFEQNVNIPLSGYFADPEFLDVFQYELEFGNAATALVEPYSVELPRKAADKLFKQENPVGEVIKMGDRGEYKVTGVLKETDTKSHIVFESLASFSTIPSLEAKGVLGKNDGEWGNWTAGWVYLLLEEGTSAQDVEKHLADLASKKTPDRFSAEDNNKYGFYLQNLQRITPGPFIGNPIGPLMPMIFVYVFGGLALIVMLTSCFNYTNLSIARALTRAREIGVRKVNGAQRYQIFFQFIAEAVVISLFALAVSLLLLQLVKPFMLNLKFAQVLRWDLEGNPYVYLVFVAFSLVIGTLAGLFPSMVLSRFQPVKVLKNFGSMKLFSKIGLRKSLLVFQFALSLIFILSVVLLYNQLSLFVNADHGFDMANKINVRLNDSSPEQLKTEILTYSNIENVSASSHVPAAGTTYGDSFKRKLDDTEGTNMDYFYTDEDYLQNMNIKLIAGRFFQQNAPETNKKQIVINTTAVKAFHFDSPQDALGELIYQSQDSAQLEIVGVIEDYNHQFLMVQIAPMALRYNPEQFNMLQVKYTGSHEDALRNIETAWAKVNPSLKMDYKDFDAEVKFFYTTIFSDFVSVIGVIAFMAITISCLGLLGMATYSTETRLKEISIRKVLGSSDGAIVGLLSKGFLVLLIIAVVIAVPLAWFLNSLWLEQVAYRTEFSLGVVLSGVGILLILGGVTIGSQTLRAAYTNPVDNLKNE